MSPSDAVAMIGTPGDQLTPAPTGMTLLLGLAGGCAVAALVGVGGMVGQRRLVLIPILLGLVLLSFHCYRLTRYGISATYAYVYVRRGRIRPIHLKDVAAFTLRADPDGAPALFVDLADGSTVPTPVTLDQRFVLGRVRMTEQQVTAMIAELERRRGLPYRA